MAKPVAAPRYPVLNLGSVGVTPPPQPALNTQASALAHNDLVAQLKAITDQQAADRAAGRATADQILQASQGGVDFLRRSGLAGDVQAQDYARAVAETKSLAGGYEGQLRTDALNAANAAGTALHGIPGNAQPVTADRGGPLANLLYGLQGSLPGQALAAQGLGSVAAARGQIPSALASGQLQALGAVQAANEQAARLDPQIAAAEGKLPGLTQQYLSNLYGQQLKQQSAAETARYHTAEIAARAAAAKADQTYKAAYLTHLQNGDTERVAHDKAMEAAGVSYHDATVAIARQNANTSRINARTARINANKPSASGDFNLPPGETRYDASGKPIVTAPARPGTGSKPKTLSAKDLQAETARINLALAIMANGGINPATGKPAIDNATGALLPGIDNRNDALLELHKEGYFATPQLAKIAMAALNRYFTNALNRPVVSPNLFGP